MRDADLEKRIWRLVKSKGVVHRSGNRLYIKVVLSKDFLRLRFDQFQLDDARLNHSVACLGILLERNLAEGHKFEQKVLFLPTAQINYLSCRLLDGNMHFKSVVLDPVLDFICVVDPAKFPFV